MEKHEADILQYDGLLVSEKELSLLIDLYDYRAMTTEQIKRKYFSNSDHYVNKVLYNLRKRRIISSHVFKGSRGKGKKGHTVHRLTETGLECLTRHGMSVEAQQQDLYVRPHQLHYITMANDVMVDLSSSGWQIWDARRVKREYRFDKRMLIAGLLINPVGKRYGFYVLDAAVAKSTLGKIHAEIKDNHPLLNNYIIFTKGQAAYEQFMDYAFHPPRKRINNRYIEQQPLYTGYDLKVISSKTGRKLFQQYSTTNKWLHVLAEKLGFEIISESMSPSAKRQSFETIVWYQGEEMYFVDLLDSNLTQIHALNSYTISDFQWEKRKILYTNYQFLEAYQNVEFSPVLMKKIDLTIADVAEWLF